MKFKFLSLLLINLHLFELIYSDDNCVTIIENLAVNNKCLSSRGELKIQMAKQAIDVNDFISLMRNQTCSDGDYYTSWSTCDWVSEIFEGIQTQYHVLNSTFSKYIGIDIKTYFKSFNIRSSRIIHHLRHTGIHNQTWVIEQLVNNTGWRIYQSYDNIYSLSAWLSNNLTKLYNSTNGDIQLSNNLPLILDNFIKNVSAGNASLSHPENITEQFKNMTPYIQFVKNYNETDVGVNFELAWKNYGQGLILNWTSFTNYLNILSEVTQFYYDSNNIVNANDNYTDKIWNDWISIYGSPDPYYYPNITTNFIIDALLPNNNNNTNYSFEIKSVTLPDYLDCMINNVYMNYLTTDGQVFGLNISMLILLILIINF